MFPARLWRINRNAIGMRLVKCQASNIESNMRAIVDLPKEQVEALSAIAKQASMSRALGDENYHVIFPFVRPGGR